LQMRQPSNKPKSSVRRTHLRVGGVTGLDDAHRKRLSLDSSASQDRPRS
jgi:hypothetical protein